jgi:hypothetical protein
MILTAEGCFPSIFSSLPQTGNRHVYMFQEGIYWKRPMLFVVVLVGFNPPPPHLHTDRIATILLSLLVCLLDLKEKKGSQRWRVRNGGGGGQENMGIFQIYSLRIVVYNLSKGVTQ